MNIRTLIALSLAPVGLTACKVEASGECGAEVQEFSFHDEDLSAQNVYDTYSWQHGVDAAEISCEEICARLAYLEDLPNTFVYTCDMTLDTDYFADQATDTATATDTGLDETLVGTMTCAGDNAEYICLGRRPQGHVEAQRSEGGLGAFLADAAHLEAASVAAFRQLGGQLRRWGAPDALVVRCREAMADEVRHAREVARLARSLGHEPSRVQVGPYAADFASAALHNGTEGCVSETWAALEAHLIAHYAVDAKVRAVFRQIAVDETRHAQLSWDLHRWFCSRLSPKARERVEAAQAEAIAALAATAARRLTALPAEFGLRDLAAAEQITARFTAGLAA